MSQRISKDAVPPSTHGGEGDGAAHSSGRFGVLTLGTMGVVFGDIGTSPLYALHAALSHLGEFRTGTTIEGAGHLPNVEKPDVVAGLIARAREASGPVTRGAASQCARRRPPQQLHTLSSANGKAQTWLFPFSA